MANETGIQLKKDLGLESLPKVFYARVIGLMAYKVYFVFFDSRRPLINITSYEAHRKEFAPVIPFKSGRRRLSLTNILKIEDFAGATENSVFIRIDLSGRFQQMGDFEESIARKEKIINCELDGRAKTHLLGLMCEDMHVEDFKTDDAVSAMTQKFRNQRKQLLGRENIAVRLIGVRFDQKQDWIQFVFRSTSTPNTPTKKDADPQANFDLQPNPAKVYTLLLQFDHFFEWMLDTLPDGQDLSLKDMKDAIRVCPVKFWSNSPAFHWQGTNYQLSQLDAAIYPTNIAPQFWNQPQYHGDNNLLDKHLMALLRYLSFFLNNMTAMANKNLQKAGIIGKVKYNFESTINHSKFNFFEKLERFSNAQWDILEKEAEQNPELYKRLHTPIKDLEGYQFLVLDNDSNILNKSLLDIVTLGFVWSDKFASVTQDGKKIIGFFAYKLDRSGDKELDNTITTLVVFSFLGIQKKENKILLTDVVNELKVLLRSVRAITWTVASGNVKVKNTYDAIIKNFPKSDVVPIANGFKYTLWGKG